MCICRLLGFAPKFVTWTSEAAEAGVANETTVATSSKCFDVYTAQALRRNGGSDPVGIKSMVDWAVANRNGDPNRVYVTGASSGAMMTNVLLGDYPDVFKAGAAFMGVPATCFATTPPNEWNSD